MTYFLTLTDNMIVCVNHMQNAEILQKMLNCFIQRIIIGLLQNMLLFQLAIRVNHSKSSIVLYDSVYKR